VRYALNVKGALGCHPLLSVKLFGYLFSHFNRQRHEFWLGAYRFFFARNLDI
jgi:hypothetical protein